VGGLAYTLPQWDPVSRFGNRRSANYSRMRPGQRTAMTISAGRCLELLEGVNLGL
jgi:hypothetical protein